MTENATQRVKPKTAGKAMVRTKSVCPTPTLTKVSVRNFEIIIDEPPSNHGEDEGPQPLEYLLASLAGCTNVIINKIAVENSISLIDLEVDVVGVLDTRGIYGVEPIIVPFPEIRLDIRLKTRNSEDDMDLVREQLDWRCPVKVIVRQSGSVIKENWDIEYV